MVRLSHLAAVLGLAASVFAAPQSPADDLTLTALHPDTNKRTLCVLTGCPKGQFCNGFVCSTCNAGGFWPIGSKSCQTCPEGKSCLHPLTLSKRAGLTDPQVHTLPSTVSKKSSPLPVTTVPALAIPSLPLLLPVNTVPALATPSQLPPLPARSVTVPVTTSLPPLLPARSAMAPATPSLLLPLRAPTAAGPATPSQRPLPAATTVPVKATPSLHLRLLGRRAPVRVRPTPSLVTKDRTRTNPESLAASLALAVTFASAVARRRKSSARTVRLA